MANNFAKMLAKKEILVPHLDNWFAQSELHPSEIEFSIHPHKEQDDAFHPSSATGCARLLYAKQMHHLPDEGRQLAALRNKTFMFGHFFHAMIQTVLAEHLKFCTWDDIEKEHRWGATTAQGNEFWARGFIDIARAIIPGQEKPILIDIKTMNAHHFVMKDLPYSMYEKYHAQVQLYLDWEDLDTAIILGCEKDNPHRFKEIIIKRDKLFVNNIYDHWEVVADAIAAGSPPDCTCEDATRCPVRELY